MSPANVSTPSGEQLRRTLAEVDKFLQEMRARDFRAPRTVAEVELAEAQRREWWPPVGKAGVCFRTLGLKSVWSCSSLLQGQGRVQGSQRDLAARVTVLTPWHWPVLARVQEQLTSRWEENQVLAKHIRDGLAQHEAGLMDLREALNRAVGITREAEELNSRNQARLEEALVRDSVLVCPLFALFAVAPLPVTSFILITLTCLQQHKRELAQDNATLKATLEAAGRTLARVSELLQGMERAKEVSTVQGPPGPCHPVRGLWLAPAYVHAEPLSQRQ